MSFTITTDVFCDFCNNWASDVGGVASVDIQKRKAWKKAKSAGWTLQPITGKHRCPRCTLAHAEKDNANE